MTRISHYQTQQRFMTTHRRNQNLLQLQNRQRKWTIGSQGMRQQSVKQTKRTKNEGKKGRKLSPNVYYHESRSRRTNKIKIFLCLWKSRKEEVLQQHSHINLNSVKIKFFHDACEQIFRSEKHYIIKKMEIYNTSNGEGEGLKSFYLYLAGQASKC